MKETNFVYKQKSITQKFVKRALALITLTVILFRHIAIYLRGLDFDEIYWESSKGIIEVILISLVVWWVLEDRFHRDYKCGMDLYAGHFLLIVLACVSGGSFYMIFKDDAAFIDSLNYTLIDSLIHGRGFAFIYRIFLGFQFSAAVIILSYALWRSCKSSGLSYGIICHSIGAMELIVFINAAINQVDLMNPDWIMTINMGLEQGLIIYSAGIFLSILYWLFYRRRTFGTTLRNSCWDMD